MGHPFQNIINPNLSPNHPLSNYEPGSGAAEPDSPIFLYSWAPLSAYPASVTWRNLWYLEVLGKNRDDDGEIRSQVVRIDYLNLFLEIEDFNKKN